MTPRVANKIHISKAWGTKRCWYVTVPVRSTRRDFAPVILMRYSFRAACIKAKDCHSKLHGAMQ